MCSDHGFGSHEMRALIINASRRHQEEIAEEAKNKKKNKTE